MSHAPACGPGLCYAPGMQRFLALVAGGILLALLFAPGAALSYGLLLALGTLALWRMPCGKAGIMVLLDALLLVLLSGAREASGEAAFYLLLLYGAGLFFLVYKRAALDGEAGCGGACPTPHAPHSGAE